MIFIHCSTNTPIHLLETIIILLPKVTTNNNNTFTKVTTKLILPIQWYITFVKFKQSHDTYRKNCSSVIIYRVLGLNMISIINIFNNVFQYNTRSWKLSSAQKQQAPSRDKNRYLCFWFFRQLSLLANGRYTPPPNPPWISLLVGV